MLAFLFLFLSPAFAQKPLATILSSAEIKIEAHDNLCKSSYAAFATFLPYSSTTIKFRTAETDRLWVLFANTPKVDFTVKKSDAVVDTNVSVGKVSDHPTKASHLVSYVAENGDARRRHSFELIVTNDSDATIDVLIQGGISEESLSIFMGSTIPQFCRQ